VLSVLVPLTDHNSVARFPHNLFTIAAHLTPRRVRGLVWIPAGEYKFAGASAARVPPIIRRGQLQLAMRFGSSGQVFEKGWL